MEPDYWEKNNIIKPTEIIVCAANQYGDLILAGARHWDSIMRAQALSIPKFRDIRREFGEAQGFINQFGEFRTREHALQIVRSNGQRFDEKRNGSTTELFSEGLY